MVLHATLRRSGGLDALSRRLAIPPADVASAAERLLPPLLARYRHVYTAAGSGQAGIRAISALTAPFGGGELAITIMSSGQMAENAAEGLLSAVIGSESTPESLVVEARSGKDERERMIALLPQLNLLVGGYLTARAEAAAGEEIVAEFEQLLAPATAD